MNPRIAVCCLAVVLAACSGVPLDAPRDAASAGSQRALETTADATSTATSLAAYKHDLANRIAQTNSTQVFIGRPQPLLRSVVVLRYHVDASGRLMRSDIMRSNRDRAAENIALATLRKSAPFPKPAPQLLRGGRVEILETWLFNNDGRFQLRTIAEPQRDE